MRKLPKLYKTTIVIWSEYNPTFQVEIDELARDAVSGESYCSSAETVLVADVTKDPDWDDTEFFGVPDDGHV